MRWDADAGIQRLAPMTISARHLRQPMNMMTMLVVTPERPLTLAKMASAAQLGTIALGYS